ncbi:hypothetical protein VKT23_001592 [Stygiomarasmius scandens]|uniref:Uncharacterized protein n=1 Tax=Marasmiellus scandens TaxID=2682957 RepID=A0ABR1JZN8_9AGAR
MHSYKFSSLAALALLLNAVPDALAMPALDHTIGAREHMMKEDKRQTSDSFSTETAGGSVQGSDAAPAQVANGQGGLVADGSHANVGNVRTFGGLHGSLHGGVWGGVGGGVYGGAYGGPYYGSYYGAYPDCYYAGTCGSGSSNYWYSYNY